MTTETGTVYALVDPRGDTIRYVGQTTRTLTQRLNGHLSSRSTRVAEWVAELRALGLRPEPRPIMEGVPKSDLLRVEEEQIESHYRQGWPLLNGGLNNRTVSVRLARQRVAKCQAIGGVLLAAAEAELEEAAQRRMRDLEQRAWLADRERFMYPEDPALQPEAVMRYVRMEGNGHQLTPEGWEHFCALVVDLAAAVKPHGHTFREVLHGNMLSAAYQLARRKMEWRVAS